MTYFIQEWKKIWKKNYAWFFLVLVCLIPAIYFIVTFHENNPNQENYIREFSLEQQLENFPDFDADEYPEYVSEEVYYETGSYDDTDHDLLDMLYSVNWSRAHTYGNLLFHNLYTGSDRSNRTIVDDEPWLIDDATALLMGEQFAYLQEKEIEPRHPVRNQFPLYELNNAYQLASNYGGETLEEALIVLDYEASRYDKGWYQMWQFIKENAHLLLLSIIALLFSGLLVMEEKQKSPHIRLLKAEGMSAPLLYGVKYAVSVLSGGVFFMGSTIAVLFTSLFYIGVGSLNYPITYYFYSDDRLLIEDMPEWVLHRPYQVQNSDVGELQVTSMELGRYLWQSFILILLILCFIFALIYLFSLLIKNEALISLIGFTLIGVPLFMPPGENNPFSYFFIHEIVTGEIRLSHQSNVITFERGVIILIGWSVALFVIGIVSYTIIEKKRGIS